MTVIGSARHVIRERSAYAYERCSLPARLLISRTGTATVPPFGDDQLTNTAESEPRCHQTSLPSKSPDTSDRPLQGTANLRSPFKSSVKVQARTGPVVAIHRNLIEDRTQWFAGRIPSSEKYHGGTVTLDLVPVLWQEYVYWLYGKEIFTEEATRSGADCDRLINRLLALYDLGVEVQDVLFQDEVMDGMIRVLELCGQDVHLDIIVPRCLEHTNQLPKVRQLLVDFIVFGEEAACLEDLKSFFDKIDDQAFKSQLAFASLERVTEERWKMPWEDVCAYHQHEEDDCHLDEVEEDEDLEAFLGHETKSIETEGVEAESVETASE